MDCCQHCRSSSCTFIYCCSLIDPRLTVPKLPQIWHHYMSGDPDEVLAHRIGSLKAAVDKRKAKQKEVRAKSKAKSAQDKQKGKAPAKRPLKRGRKATSNPVSAEPARQGSRARKKSKRAEVSQPGSITKSYGLTHYC